MCSQVCTSIPFFQTFMIKLYSIICQFCLSLSELESLISSPQKCANSALSFLSGVLMQSSYMRRLYDVIPSLYLFSHLPRGLWWHKGILWQTGRVHVRKLELWFDFNHLALFQIFTFLNRRSKWLKVGISFFEKYVTYT